MGNSTKRGLSLALLVASLLLPGSASSFDEAAADPAVAACQARLAQTITTPSTIKVVHASITKSSLHLDYDAENSGGATIRGGYDCQFSLDPLIGFYFADDPYFDWLSCELTGKPENAGLACGSVKATWALFGAPISAVTQYPILKSRTELSQ